MGKGHRPFKEVIPDLPVGDPEVKGAQILSTETTEQDSLADRLSRLSPWSRAVQAVARILQWINKDKLNGLSTVVEWEDAERLIIKDIQRQTYPEELKLLKKGSQLPLHNKLPPFNSFLDNNGVIKVGGTLCDSNFLQSNTLRSFWRNITSQSWALHTVMKGLNIEVKEWPSMRSGLLDIRDWPSHLIFVNVWLVEGSGDKKSREWTALDVSTLKKEFAQKKPPASLLEPFILKCKSCQDMSTDSFIIVLRCFIAICGAVHQIKSDQGSNFPGAKNKLKLLKKLIVKLVTFLSENPCIFVMNAPDSSHVGEWESN